MLSDTEIEHSTRSGEAAERADDGVFIQNS